jgi:hemerythrin-like metal-binding protein
MSYTYVYTTWTPDLGTGNDTVDDQHKQLIAILNTLFDAHRNGRGRKEVELTMDFLVKYTVMHFSEEEEMLQKNSFPQLVRHKRIHAGFKDTAHELLRELILEGPTDELITRVYMTMGRWVVDHIKGEDFKWPAHLRENGGII